MITVTTVTRNATHDSLSEQEYRDIFIDLQEGRGLRDFAEMIDSFYSFATWGKYKNHKWSLTRQARNELRRAVDLPELVPTVADALADVDPDAEVLAIGDKLKNRVLLTTQGESLTIYANGTVTASTGRVTQVTRNARKRLRREMTPQQAAAWDVLSKEERDTVLGIITPT